MLTIGRAGAFSMNGPKPLSAGEGGFVLTDDDELYYRLLLFGHYNKRCRNEIPEDHPLRPYAVTGMGLKFRIHPLAASIALEQLGHLDSYLNGRDFVARYLCSRLRELPGIVTPTIPDGHRAAWYGLPLTYVPEELNGVPVESFHAALLAEGLVEVDRPGSTCPLNRLPLFRDPNPLLARYGRNSSMSYEVGQFPVAERVWQHTLKLPVWHTEEDMPLVDRYIDGFCKVIDNHHELEGR
jgi:dTDP-4-amino-4,6-dideoxygalactose transaminase